MSLSVTKCVSCRGGKSLSAEQLKELCLDIHPEWVLSTDKKTITRTYTFKNFLLALQFVNKVGALAEKQGHHPGIDFGWGRVTITLTTHAIAGLSESDFVLADAIDSLGD